jgi:long-chain fatty acid transport protein
MIFCTVALAALAGQAWAGGLYISEFATPSMGVASAGQNAVANDASTALHNPAGMTRLKGRQLMLGVGGVLTRVKFDRDADSPVPGGNGGDAGGAAPLLGTYYVHSLTDRLKLGGALYSISAAVLDYDDDWTGRFFVRDVSIFTLTFAPSVAYRITDWLSVGGGPIVLVGSLEMDLELPVPRRNPWVELDGTDIVFGFDAGVLIELSPRTRIGVLYVSESELDFDGDIKIHPRGLSTDVDTELPLPQFVQASIYHEINDQFALLALVDWEDWSTLDNINLSTSRGSRSLARNWEDTWKFAAGIHYRPHCKWLLQAGMSYDTSPVDKEDRTPDMPIDRQIRYAIGAQYQWRENIRLGAAFEYIDFGEAKIDKRFLKGNYHENDGFFLAVNANIKF